MTGEMDAGALATPEPAGMKPDYAIYADILYDEDAFDSEAQYGYLHNGNFERDLEIVSPALHAWKNCWYRESGYPAQRSAITSSDVKDYLEDKGVDDRPNVHTIGDLLAILSRTPAVTKGNKAYGHGYRYDISEWTDKHKDAILDALDNPPV